MRLHLGVLTIALFACSSAFGQAVAGVGAASTSQANSPTANAVPQVAVPAEPAPAGAPAPLETIPASTPPEASRQPAEAPQPVLIATNPASASWTRQPRSVITNDDVAAMRTGVAINFLWSKTEARPPVDPSFCDAGCEAEARAAAGMGSTPDGEWQGQFEAARTDLANDAQWKVAYLDGLQKAQQYCVFQNQAGAFANEHAERPGGEGEQYVGDVNHELGQQMDGAADRLQREIHRAQRIDSVRAAMMQVLAERAFNQCPATPRR